MTARTVDVRLAARQAVAGEVDVGRVDAAVEDADVDGARSEGARMRPVGADHAHAPLLRLARIGPDLVLELREGVLTEMTLG